MRTVHCCLLGPGTAMFDGAIHAPGAWEILVVWIYVERTSPCRQCISSFLKNISPFPLQGNRVAHSPLGFLGTLSTYFFPFYSVMKLAVMEIPKIQGHMFSISIFWMDQWSFPHSSWLLQGGAAHGTLPWNRSPSQFPSPELALSGWPPHFLRIWSWEWGSVIELF